MTRIRQWLIAFAVAAILCLSFASYASADPGDGGGGQITSSKRGFGPTAFDPGDGGGGP